MIHPVFFLRRKTHPLLSDFVCEAMQRMEMQQFRDLIHPPGQLKNMGVEASLSEFVHENLPRKKWN
jgi:hypothetical protein